ncbi:MAG: PDZ domain-containing protein [Acidimicrobiia bacterium]|nr:MAG: PDZ domain-containing protein [Acidimicrobiia bacterium]
MQRVPTWSVFLIGLAMLLSGAGMAASVIDVPYYAYEPGPVYELDQFVEAEGADDVNGEFLMLTVALPEVTALEFLVAWFDPAVDLVERERVRPVGVSQEEYRERNLQSMLESKNTAIFVALDHLGYEVTLAGDGVLVAGIIEGTGSEGVLEVGDVITSIDGVPVFVNTDATSEIGSHDIGEVLQMKVLRNGEELDVAVELSEHTQDEGRPMVGFLATTYNWRYESEVDVDIDSQNIGGPSAGLMYALTIIDLLSEEDLLDGAVVAGTGTIDAEGNVGAIGGIRQKLVAAEREGAQYALVPDGNWDAAQTAPIEDLELVRVSTIDDALAFLATLG